MLRQIKAGKRKVRRVSSVLWGRIKVNKVGGIG